MAAAIVLALKAPHALGYPLLRPFQVEFERIKPFFADSFCSGRSRRMINMNLQPSNTHIQIKHKVKLLIQWLHDNVAAYALIKLEYRHNDGF